MGVLCRRFQVDDLGQAVVVVDIAQDNHPVCSAAGILLPPDTRRQERAATHRTCWQSIDKTTKLKSLKIK